MALIRLFGEYGVVTAKETFQNHGVKLLSSRVGCFVQEERKQDVGTTVDAYVTNCSSLRLHYHQATVNDTGHVCVCDAKSIELW